MKDLEKQSFKLEDALDDTYLNGDETKQFLKPNGSTVMDIDNIFPHKTLEDPSFEINEPYLGKWDDEPKKGIKEIPLDESEEDSISVDNALFSIKKGKQN